MLTPGALLNNRYRIISILGQGGMGAVYHAVDENLNIAVAVKENLFLSDEYARQFQIEANILANLRHPNLTRVADYFVLPDKGQYLVMDYIDGEDLRQRIERLGSLSELEVVLIGSAVCDALTYLHTRQPAIIHRDIKPGNIKISPDGEVFLVDFGLAKVFEESQATTTGARAMTPGFSPPEQYGFARTDVRSDIYSLGATLYAALTGIIPEDGLARATGKARLTNLRRLQSSLSRRVAGVIEKSLAVEPVDRFQTAEEFKKALQDAVNISSQSAERLIIPPPPASQTIEEQKFELKPLAVSAERISKKIPRSMVGWWLGYIGLIVLISAAYFAPPPYHLLGVPTLLQQIAFLRATATSTQLPQETLTQPAIFPIKTVATATAEPTRTATMQPSRTPSPTVELTLTKTPLPSPTAIGGSGGEIVYASNRSGTSQLWIMDANGANQRQITQIEGGACQPAWSPDGNRIAFISPCKIREDFYPAAQIYLMEPDNPQVQPLAIAANPAGDFDPAWSPDGTHLSFTSLRTGQAHIFLADLSLCTSAKPCAPRELSSERFNDFQSAWMQDGKTILFVRQFQLTQIWSMNMDGSNPQKISPSSERNHHWPFASYDQTNILYAQMSPSPSIPWLVRFNLADQSEIRIIPADLNQAFPIAKPAWSPDGKWILFDSWPDGVNHDIYRMDAASLEVVRITSDRAYDFDAAWRPVPK